MPVVTGTLSDFGLASLDAFDPQIIFTASGPAVNAGKLLATKPVVVTPAANGTFSVTLAATEDLRPAAWYTIRIQWRDTAGAFIGVDFPDWKLFVPEAGGSLTELTDLAAKPLKPLEVWVVYEDGPEPPGSKSGDYIYNSFTGDLTRIL